jgi:hypothetical protein
MYKREKEKLKMKEYILEPFIWRSPTRNNHQCDDENVTTTTSILIIVLYMHQISSQGEFKMHQINEIRKTEEKGTN